jgi:DNA polymerase III epsilon subunit-like protein
MYALPEKTLIIFDTEVTELALSDAAGTFPELIEIAGVKIGPECENLGEFTTLVQPQNLESVTEFTTKITGITPAMLEDAPVWADTWRKWAEFTGFNSTRLAAWGAASDQPWLRMAYFRARLGYPHLDPVIDVRSIAYGLSAVYGFKVPRWSLAEACKRFEIQQTTKHRALADSRATVEVLKALLRLEDA